MPIALAVRTVVRMNCGLTRAEIARWTSDVGGSKAMRKLFGNDRFDGPIHRVVMKKASSDRWSAKRPTEKERERKTSSPRNLQLTVHLNKNVLVSSKARAQ